MVPRGQAGGLLRPAASSEPDLRFLVYDLGFRVWVEGLGFRVQGLGFGFWV